MAAEEEVIMAVLLGAGAQGHGLAVQGFADAIKPGSKTEPAFILHTAHDIGWTIFDGGQCFGKGPGA